MKLNLAYTLFEEERERQRELGWDEDHDAHHDAGHFALLIEKQLNDLKRNWYHSDLEATDKTLVKIGALAAAALETNGEE